MLEINHAVIIYQENENGRIRKMIRPFSNLNSLMTYVNNVVEETDEFGWHSYAYDILYDVCFEGLKIDKE